MKNTGQFEWLRQRLEIMHKVFAPIVKSLKPEKTPEIADLNDQEGT